MNNVRNGVITKAVFQNRLTEQENVFDARTQKLENLLLVLSLPICKYFVEF